MTAPGPDDVIVRQYVDQGYDVEIPQGLTGTLAAVDLVARRGNEVVFVQVKTAGVGAVGTAVLAEFVAGLPGARLDVIHLPREAAGEAPEPPTVVRRARAAAALLGAADGTDATAAEAALVLMSSAAEGALRLLGARSGIPQDERAGLSAVASQLRSDGLLWQEHWEVLDALGRARDLVVHGVVNDPPDRGLLAAAEPVVLRLAEQASLTAQDLVEWFLARYKDPTDGVPYDGVEGGYQYVDGGPFDARDVLENMFDFAAPPVIDEAVRELEGVSSEWVAADKY